MAQDIREIINSEDTPVFYADGLIYTWDGRKAFRKYFEVALTNPMDGCSYQYELSVTIRDSKRHTLKSAKDFAENWYNKRI